MRIPFLSPVLASLIVIPAAGAQSPGQATKASRPVFIAALRGTGEVPPVATKGDGTAKLTLVGSRLHYQISVDDLRDVTGVFLHVGRFGQAEPVVAALFEGNKTGPVYGMLASGTLRSADVRGITMTKLIQALRRDDTYLSVHTRSHPDGELRGELRIEPAVAGG